MKKTTFFIIGLSLFLMISCVSIQPQTAQKISSTDHVVNIGSGPDLKITTIVIDDCEYLLGIAGYDPRTMVMSHKGNCKYCAARKKEQ